jgi:hypothetical protein
MHVIAEYFLKGNGDKNMPAVSNTLCMLATKKMLPFYRVAIKHSIYSLLMATIMISSSL